MLCNGPFSYAVTICSSVALRGISWKGQMKAKSSFLPAYSSAAFVSTTSSSTSPHLSHVASGSSKTQNTSPVLGLIRASQATSVPPQTLHVHKVLVWLFSGVISVMVDSNWRRVCCICVLVEFIASVFVLNIHQWIGSDQEFSRFR